MTILFCGDPHGQFTHIIEAVQEHRPAAVILLGDMQAQRPLHIELEPILGQTEIWFIHGNHDTDSDADHDHLFGSALADRNLHAKVVFIAGLRIAGLGGVFRGKVWTLPAPTTFENPNTTWSDAAKATSGAVVCHSPTGAPFFQSNTSACKSSGPTFWSRSRPPVHTHMIYRH